MSEGTRFQKTDSLRQSATSRSRHSSASSGKRSNSPVSPADAFELAVAITASLDHNTIIDTGLNHLRRTIPADSWTIYLTEKEPRRSEPNRLETAGNSGVPLNLDLAAFGPETLLGRALRSGEPVYVSGAEISEPRYLRNGVSVVLCLPLAIHGHTIGVIEAIFSKPGKRGAAPAKAAGQNGQTRKARNSLLPGQIDLAQRIANLIAVALHNATLYADVEHLCLIDDLTRLYNIRFLRQALESEIRRAKRYHSSVALIFLDLDGFKSVNDAHGHLIGSAALIETAHIIYAMVRDTDFVARYGGDEFVIILPETSADRAAQIAERIRRGIEHHRFGGTEAIRVRLTASFGVAAYPEHGLTSYELINCADAAMYSAKETNKNAVVLAT